MLIRKYLFEYDSHNNRVKSTRVDDSGNRFVMYWYEYEYDQYGNKIKRFNIDETDGERKPLYIRYKYLLI
ncbi:hypothetical protein [Halonatronum saccharophilum]|uniref:hypothetical protein n=1 Tax=Halonatronum saccharophilum TaxID=150060 RepID=UPI00047F45E2|nr:hypothetical protein [Halonatronum saccharophilum]